MKHIKPYKIFENKSPNFPTTREEVIEVCKRYDIRYYTINDDLSIDISGGVFLDRKKLEYLPVRFNYVSGSFNCSDNKLKSLEGCPQTISGSFNCSDNYLESLKGCPQTVDEVFNCSKNVIKSLKGCPQEVRAFHCFGNRLESLEGGPQTVNEDYDCSNNTLNTLKGCSQTVGGYFNIYNNKLTDLEYFPEVNGPIYTTKNLVHHLVYTFIDNADIFMIEDFVDYEIVRNGNTVMLDRLETFIRDNDLEMPDLEEIKKKYKIIE